MSIIFRDEWEPVRIERRREPGILLDRRTFDKKKPLDISHHIQIYLNSKHRNIAKEFLWGAAKGKRLTMRSVIEVEYTYLEYREHYAAFNTPRWLWDRSDVRHTQQKEMEKITTEARIAVQPKPDPIAVTTRNGRHYTHVE